MPTLTPLQVAAAGYIGGFKTELVDAVALANVESGFNTDAINGAHHGLWQISKKAHPDLFEGRDWRNPADNARMANILFQKGSDLGNSDGDFDDWKPTYGGQRFKLARPAAKRAVDDFNKRLSKGEDPEKILGAKRSDGRSPVESQPPSDIIRGATNLFPNLEGLSKALTSGNTWLRVGQVLLGALLIVVGVVKMSGGVASLVPVGRIAKAIT